MDALTHLWHSTAALYERFGLDATSTPPSKRRGFLREEVGELCDVSAEQHERAQLGAFTERFDEEQHHLAEEAADVIVTTLGLLQAHGVELWELLDMVEFVADKNDAKTPETHALVDGKITRRQA